MQETNGTTRYGHNVSDFQKLRTLGNHLIDKERERLVEFTWSNSGRPRGSTL